MAFSLLLTVDCEDNPDFPRYCDWRTLGYDFVIPKDKEAEYKEKVTNWLKENNQPLMSMYTKPSTGHVWTDEQILECIKKGYKG